MSIIQHTEIVPYSSEQMFYLINDVNSYYKFIPGCNKSIILQHYENELIAKLQLVMCGVEKSLVTRNFYIENEKIFIFLVKGPFKSFYGCWEFTPVACFNSKIKYFFFYEFSSLFFENFFDYTVRKMYKHIVWSFLFRARRLYGIR